MTMAMATKATWCIDETWNAVHITFDGIPNVKIRDKMKAVGFRWHKRDKYWFAKQNPKRISVAKKICEAKFENETETENPKAEEPKPEKEGAKSEKKNKYGVQVGDIFSMTWGYDQTNVDFFQVVKLCGEKSCRVVQVTPKVTVQEAESGMSATTYYEITRDLLKPHERSIFIKDNEKGDIKRIEIVGDKPRIKVGDHLADIEPQGEVSHFTSWWR